MNRILPGRLAVAFAAGMLLNSAVSMAQSERHGRKYKAPPETGHVEVLVVRDTNGKVVENAGVIFHPSKDGVEEGNLEVKSGPDGKAMIDIIPLGSTVQVQVIAGGFTTYSGSLTLDQPSKQMTVRLVRPVQQVSAYGAGEGGDNSRKFGVQESNHRILQNTGPVKPLSAGDPVIKLPGAPADPKATGDPTVPKDHNVKTGETTPPKQPNKSSAPTGPTVDGTAGSSPSN